MIEVLGSIAPGRPLREGLDRILQANMGALIVVGRRARGPFHLLRRLSARRRVQSSEAFRAGEDGRGHHPGRRFQPHRPGQRPPRAQPRHRHVRDRDPAPHGGTGGPLVGRARYHRLRGPVGDHGLPGRAAAPAGAGRAPPGPGQPGAGDARGLPGPPGRRDQCSLGSRGRGHGDRQGRRHGAAAHRDGPPHRRGGRRLQHRAGHRQPAGAAAAGGDAGRGGGGERRQILRDYLPPEPGWEVGDAWLRSAS